MFYTSYMYIYLEQQDDQRDEQLCQVTNINGIIQRTATILF